MQIKHPSQNQSTAPFLKWLGGKAALMQHIEPVLRSFGHRTRLVDPFVGGGSIFMKTNFDEYLLADANPHLIELYNSIQKDVDNFISTSKPLFTSTANSQEIYNIIRESFNEESDSLTRATYFLYLNKFGFRGVVRYSSRGYFNTPFGHNQLPGFPEEEIRAFAHKARLATFVCTDFVDTIASVRPGDVLYLDPPYLDSDNAASFRDYVKGGFSAYQQRTLADLARATAQRGTPVVISNHLTAEALDLYRGAVVHEIPVTRNLNPKAGTRRTTEGLFVFEPHKHPI